MNPEIEREIQFIKSNWNVNTYEEYRDKIVSELRGSIEFYKRENPSGDNQIYNQSIEVAEEMIRRYQKSTSFEEAIIATKDLGGKMVR